MSEFEDFGDSSYEYYEEESQNSIDQIPGHPLQVVESYEIVVSHHLKCHQEFDQ